MYVYRYNNIHTCVMSLCMHIHIRMLIYMYTHVYIHICIYMYIYMYMHDTWPGNAAPGKTTCLALLLAGVGAALS